jgi:hypothetical protein
MTRINNFRFNPANPANPVNPDSNKGSDAQSRDINF